jgi:hypothetical protein
MYEHHKQPLASNSAYYRRIINNIILAFIILLVCLVIGILGYRFSTGMLWIDALHNASMILSGMGLVDADKVTTDSGKIFSSFYALFSGVVFITNIGIILAPAVHRLLHRLHMPEE